MQLKFLGAAGTVSGSKYLLTTHKRKYLIDCGLFQGLKSLTQKNWQEDPNLPDVDAVIITHAHIDHSGYIPRLIKNGFSGPIYCSPGTFELLKILLPDSGHLQEEEALYVNKKGYSRHKPALPFYTREEAENALNYIEPLSIHERHKLFHDLTVTFYRTGHILGASFLYLEAQNRTIIFSGDVGRLDDTIMMAPESPPNADYIVIESTYGDRIREKEDTFKKMAAIINNAEENKSVVVIPSFAVGRSQHILYLIYQLKKAQAIGDIKTFLDSPMAIDATDLYCQYSEEHRLNKDLAEAVCKTATLSRTVEESKSINDVPGPKIIISSSGMISGGRVLHHVAQYIGDQKNYIVLVGYQAAGTRGRSLLEGAHQIKIFGQYYEVHAHIENLHGLSAHADQQDLIKWLKQSKLKNPKVFVTHGEPQAAITLRQKLKETFQWQVEVPKEGDEFKL
jgi:metallo-beta-lactamase family protein